MGVRDRAAVRSTTLRLTSPRRMASPRALCGTAGISGGGGMIRPAERIPNLVNHVRHKPIERHFVDGRLQAAIPDALCRLGAQARAPRIRVESLPQLGAGRLMAGREELLRLLPRLVTQGPGNLFGAALAMAVLLRVQIDGPWLRVGLQYDPNLLRASAHPVLDIYPFLRHGGSLRPFHFGRFLDTHQRPVVNKLTTGPRNPYPISNHDGGRGRSRTYDPLIKSQLLYQLSYTPKNPGSGGWTRTTDSTGMNRML